MTRAAYRVTTPDAVRDLVARLGRASIDGVADELGVSKATSRRYLVMLLDRGELERGWVIADSTWWYALPGQAPQSETRVVECAHKRARHQHGTPQAYKLDGCRCVPCRRARRIDGQQHSRAKAYGRSGAGWAAAGPVRAHIEQLQAAGMGRRTIVAAAKVSGSTMSGVLYGRRGKSPVVRVNAEFARKVLAVPIPGVAGLAPSAVDAGAGTRRRVQALVAIGWTVARLAPELGVDLQRLRRALAGRKVTADTVRAVAAGYDRLWATPPPARTQRERISVTQARKLAARRRWAGPLAWDDETIDDPKARPNRGHSAEAQATRKELDELAIERAMGGTDTHLTPAEQAEAVYRLADRGLNDGQIGRRLHIAHQSAARIRRARPVEETEGKGVAA